ncbi:hypothetical protein KSP39_PZI023200 [Platanthera zijinensis]|uniref:Transmembrane protein n=1 Tax=Platanthera zijinensis TaxID=2320716 RepID=A0AAP0AV92_9ASPA
MDGDDQQHSRLFNELCALIFSVLRSPHLLFHSAPPPRSQFTPSGLASLLLGASLALMLCGSVTFVLGCILMPWVIGLVMFLYFLGVISSISGIGKAILCSSVPSATKISLDEVSGMPLR